MAIPNLFYAPQSGLQRDTKSFAGSYSRLFFCPEELVDWDTNYPGYFTASTTGLLDQELIQSVLPNGAFFLAKVPNTKKGYIEEQKQGDGGPFMLITVQAFIPFVSLTNHLQLDRMKYHRYILLVEFPDGLVKVVGNKGTCAYLTHAEDRGESYKNVPGVTVKFTCEMEDKPLIYTLPLPV